MKYLLTLQLNLRKLKKSFKFRKLHLYEVKEVREVKVVRAVCFVRQMLIYIPHGGIGFNSECSDNFNNF